MAENQKIYVSAFDAKEYDISELPIRWQRELQKLSYLAVFCAIHDIKVVSDSVIKLNALSDEDLGV